MTDLLTSAQVAKQLRMSKARFSTRHRALQVDHGFPAPLPYCKRPLLWRASDVAEWLANVGRTAPGQDTMAQPDGGSVVLMARARRGLRAADAVTP